MKATKMRPTFSTKLPLGADEVGKTLVPLIDVLEKALRVDLVLGPEPGSGLVAVPDVDVAKQLVAETGNAASAAKVPGREE